VSNGRSPRGFRVAVLNNSDDFGAYRWTVDTADDLEFVRQVYRHFGGRCDFSWLDVLRLVHSHPEMMSINAGVRHKTLEDLDERAPGADAS
jgi:spore coat polysaccharide biosynthesis protein SpsF